MLLAQSEKCQGFGDSVPGLCLVSIQKVPENRMSLFVVLIDLPVKLKRDFGLGMVHQLLHNIDRQARIGPVLPSNAS